ncbi:hypothetical protein AS156_30905 [Bradyrhizobium macuxiense]|uniref:Uncharacterized protein n=1 Tax=Bradyrhizobium macuxiense TaxID=1755647 RepID=A0A120FR72_9BRAD|nr:hypothetical protein AS156_30905 [Bradyrhizobium macuxiense]
MPIADAIAARLTCASESVAASFLMSLWALVPMIRFMSPKVMFLSFECWLALNAGPTYGAEDRPHIG